MLSSSKVCWKSTAASEAHPAQRRAANMKKKADNQSSNTLFFSHTTPHRPTPPSLIAAWPTSARSAATTTSSHRPPRAVHFVHFRFACIADALILRPRLPSHDALSSTSTVIHLTVPFLATAPALDQRGARFSRGRDPPLSCRSCAGQSIRAECTARRRRTAHGAQKTAQRWPPPAGSTRSSIRLRGRRPRRSHAPVTAYFGLLRGRPIGARARILTYPGTDARQSAGLLRRRRRQRKASLHCWRGTSSVQRPRGWNLRALGALAVAAAIWV